jgi:Tfp pilus assembly protein PilF
VEVLRKVVAMPSSKGAIGARAHLLLADALYLGDDDAIAARSEYIEALKSPETAGDAALAIGTIAAQSGKIAEAKKYFERAATALKPGERRARAYASLGRLADEARDVAGATGWYEKALKDDPNNAWAARALKK